MKSYQQLARHSDVRRELVSRCVEAVLEAVEQQRGPGGLAMRRALCSLEHQRPAALQRAIDGLLDDFLLSVSPLLGEAEAGGGASDSLLRRHLPGVAETLLTHMDARAARLSHASLRKAYQAVRPLMSHKVEEALPLVINVLITTLSDARQLR